MVYCWDEQKNRRNLAKHGVSLDTAVLVFDDPYALSVQDRHVVGEVRWQTIGFAGGVVLLLVAHTSSGTEDDENSEETVRIISARRATRLERRAYEDRRK